MKFWLQVENLLKERTGFSLKADFYVGPGERVALVGKSGSGKTSLFRVLAGFDQEFSGRISLGGSDITRLAPQKREIGVVFQEPALFQSMNVLENAAFGLKIRGMEKSKRDELALDWLNRVQLASHADACVDQLSGGEKQRLALIRALIWKPQLLLLDEPFSAIDSALRQVLKDEILEFLRDRPVPVLIATHDEADVRSFATQKLELQWNPPALQRSISRVLTNVPLSD